MINILTKTKHIRVLSCIYIYIFNFSVKTSVVIYIAKKITTLKREVYWKMCDSIC